MAVRALQLKVDERAAIVANAALDQATKTAMLVELDAAITRHETEKKKAATGVRNNRGVLLNAANLQPAQEEELRVSYVTRVANAVQLMLAMLQATLAKIRKSHPSDKVLRQAINASLSKQTADMDKQIKLLNTIVGFLPAATRAILQPHLPLTQEKLSKNLALLAVLTGRPMPALRQNFPAWYAAAQAVARALRQRSLCNIVLDNMRSLLQHHEHEARLASHQANMLRGLLAAQQPPLFAPAVHGQRQPNAGPPAVGRYSSVFATPLSRGAAAGFAMLLQASAARHVSNFVRDYNVLLQSTWPARFQATQLQMRHTWGPVRDALLHDIGAFRGTDAPVAAVAAAQQLHAGNATEDSSDDDDDDDD
jgi:hypothetical protein